MIEIEPEFDTTEEREKMRKEALFQEKCDNIAAALLANLMKEIQIHHGNTKLARGIARSVVMSLYEIDYHMEKH